jgi:hypothetical protein
MTDNIEEEESKLYDSTYEMNCLLQRREDTIRIMLLPDLF